MRRRLALAAGGWLGLLGLFALGLAIRLVLAAISDGLAFDVLLFREWSTRLAARGPALFYEPGYFVDYPPGYLYVLLVVGHASRLAFGGPPPVAILKLPAILADLGVAVLALLIAARITRNDSSRAWAGPAAAAAVLLNPGPILISSVWGQVDSVLALLVLAGLFLIGSARLGLTGEIAGVVVLATVVATKPQAVFALPVVAVILFHRHLAGGSRHAARNLAMRLALLLAIGFAVVAAMFAPFGLSAREAIGFYRDAGGVYPFTSLWAFNLWGLAGFYLPDSGAEALTIGGITAFHVGLIAFAVALAALAVRAWQSLDAGVDATAVAVFGAAAVTCAAFALLTRSHERYLYLAIATLAPFAGLRPLRMPFAVLSLLFLLNVHFVYVYYSRHAVPPGGAWTIAPLYDALFGAGRDAWQLDVLSAATAVVCLGVAVFGWRRLERSARAAPLPSAPRTEAFRTRHPTNEGSQC